MSRSLSFTQILSSAVVASVMVTAAHSAAAATIVADGIVCTLSEAIHAANTNAPVGGCRAGNDRSGGRDIIELRTEVTISVWDSIDADGCPNGLPAVTSRIKIYGRNHTISRSTELGTPSFRIFDSSNGDLTLDHVTVRNGLAEFCNGAGINGVVTLIDSAVSDNLALNGVGGGIAGSLVRLVRSSVSRNQGGGLHVTGAALLWESRVTQNFGFTDSSGGGLDVRGPALLVNSTIADNLAGGRFSIGGGIYAEGTVIVVGSTLSGNTAAGDIGVGGAVLLFNGDLTLINSTITGNLASSAGGGINYGGSGGAIFSTAIDPLNTGAGGPITLIHSTIAGNTAEGPVGPGFTGGVGGGIRADSVRLTNSVIAGNTATDPTARDCSGVDVQFVGVNLVEDGSCGAALEGQLVGDAGLGALADNGGPTLTRMPRRSSSLIDQIPVRRGKCRFTSVDTDQRGARRPEPAGGACDIGAVEYRRRPIFLSNLGDEDTDVLDGISLPIELRELLRAAY